MSSTTWTEADLTAIEEAIAKGIFKVDYNDRSVTYRSLDDMLKIRDLIRRCLGKTAKASRILCSAEKGTC